MLVLPIRKVGRNTANLGHPISLLSVSGFLPKPSLLRSFATTGRQPGFRFCRLTRVRVRSSKSLIFRKAQRCGARITGRARPLPSLPAKPLLGCRGHASATHVRHCQPSWRLSSKCPIECLQVTSDWAITSPGPGGVITTQDESVQRSPAGESTWAEARSATA